MIGSSARLLVVASYHALVGRVRCCQNSCRTAKDGTLYSIPLLFFEVLELRCAYWSSIRLEKLVDLEEMLGEFPSSENSAIYAKNL